MAIEFIQYKENSDGKKIYVISNKHTIGWIYVSEGKYVMRTYMLDEFSCDVFQAIADKLRELNGDAKMENKFISGE